MPDTRPHIHFETSGPATGQTLVLIEGLGAQMIAWRAGFVEKLVAKGFQVIRLDNRDVGLSEIMGGEDQLEANYTLADMADDVCSVLDKVGVDQAHIVGQSMGGAIAQTMALTRPERVRSLGLFYTAPAFSPEFLTEEIREIIVAETMAAATPAPPLTRDEKVTAFVDRARLAASVDTPFPEAWHTQLAGMCLDRCDRPDGAIRQSTAIIRAGDWRADLERLTMPIAIFHGRADRLVKVEAGFELAARLKTSELHVYPGMGHVIAMPLWDDFANIIARTAARAAGA